MPAPEPALPRTTMPTRTRTLAVKPSVHDVPPVELAAHLLELQTALDGSIPAKHLDRNLIIATWNIRAFGDITDKWLSEGEDSPKRDIFSLRCIAEIVSRFDVVAIQEVKGNIKGLRHLIKALGPDWGLLLTDVTRGGPGNDERMAFVFDTRRVKPSGLACELVVPDEYMSRVGDDVLRRQFARTPYAASFITAGETFILVALHVLYGNVPKDRIPELKAIADWMADWARRLNEWEHNLIALGDFNIDRLGDPAYEAFTSTGLRTPPELDAVPRTIFGSSKDKRYDQVAWFTGDGGSPRLHLDYTGRADGFDFTDVVLKELTRQELSWRLSDHLPLWTEFSIRH